MIRSILVLIGCQCLGELLRLLLHLPVSGPVLGMALLVLILFFIGGPPAGLRTASDRLLSYLAILFVPAGVGIVLYRDEFTRHWALILVSLVGSSILAIVATALAGQAALRLFDRRRPPLEAEKPRRQSEGVS